MKILGSLVGLVDLMGCGDDGAVKRLEVCWGVFKDFVNLGLARFIVEFDSFLPDKVAVDGT